MFGRELGVLHQYIHSTCEEQGDLVFVYHEIRRRRRRRRRKATYESSGRINVIVTSESDIIVNAHRNDPRHLYDST